MAHLRGAHGRDGDVTAPACQVGDRPGGSAGSPRPAAPSASRSRASIPERPSALLSTARCGTSGGTAGRMRAVNASNAASFPASRSRARSSRRRRRVASSQPDPHEPDRIAPELGDPLPPALGVTDPAGEGRHEQDRASPFADLPRDRRHPAVLVDLDVLVVPGALALAVRATRDGEGGGHEAAVEGVLVQQGGHRPQQGQEGVGDGALARPGGARDDPHVRARPGRGRGGSGHARGDPTDLAAVVNRSRAPWRRPAATEPNRGGVPGRRA